MLGVSDERYNCKGTTYCFGLHRTGCLCVNIAVPEAVFIYTLIL